MCLPLGLLILAFGVGFFTCVLLVSHLHCPVLGLLVASFLETLVGWVANVPFVYGKASPLTKRTLGHSSRLRRAGHAATGNYPAALPE